jgi:hypothetical protein
VTLTGVFAREEKRNVALHLTILAGQALPLPEDEAEDEAERLEKIRKKEEKKRRKEGSNSGVRVDSGLAAAHMTATALTPPAHPEVQEEGSKRDKIKGFFSRMKHRDGAQGFEPYVCLLSPLQFLPFISCLDTSRSSS